jgi:hypothetical protein
MIENPVFIVGTERSGSNLLRLLLNELEGVCVPHPPHLLRDLTPVIGRYDDLSRDENFLRLIRDAIKLVELHFAPWPFKLDEAAVMLAAPARDLYSVYAAIYEQYRRHRGKARWACKSTFMIQHVDEILNHHRAPQFIHLVRDPRDVAVSARGSVFCHYHPYFVADLWRREQNIALGAAARLSTRTWFTLRYEDLIQDPATAMKAVCAFLNEPYRDDLLRFFEKSEARELAKLSRSWENVARPIIAANREKYRTSLTPQEIALIEATAGLEMRALGYATATKGSTPNALSRAGYLVAEEWMMLKEEGLALLKDRNARHRFKKKAYLWSLRFRG